MDRAYPEPLGIEGWMDEDELDWLGWMARGCHVIVEIGSWKGRSAMALARATPGTVFLIDHFSGANDGSVEYGELDEVEGRKRVRNALLTNLSLPIQQGKVFLIERSSSEAFPIVCDVLRHRSADMIFIDGDHSYPGVKADILNYSSLLGSGGLLCGHDADWPSVRKAVDELFPDWMQGPGSIWYRSEGRA